MREREKDDQKTSRKRELRDELEEREKGKKNWGRERKRNNGC